MPPPPDRDRSRHPSGGRKAKRAYAAQPYLGPRDAGFYALLWAAGVAAGGGGASQGALLAGATLWAAWLLLGWVSSRWLRTQEDFDSQLNDTLAGPLAGAAAGWGLPALGALVGLVVTAGRCWWEPLACAGLAGMAAAAPLAFLERSFSAGTLWALVALAGGLGHPAPAWPAAALAAGAGLWYLVVTTGQARAFRHFPAGPAPDPSRLGRDLLLPAGVLVLGGGLAWLWTPAMTPKAVQIAPALEINLWEPGKEKWRPPTKIFGKPKLDGTGAPEAVSGAASQAAEALLGKALTHLRLFAALAVLVAIGAGVWLWLRRKGKREALALEQERKRILLRGAGVQARKVAPLEEPSDPREAVIYVYNRLREDLAGVGVPRQESLTPAEYADALLDRPGAGDLPVAELTELFYRAEYSAHPVGAADRDGAKDAYRKILSRMTAEARK